jgi:CubicO group peptidase (beta-lactamase class C family)
MKISPDLAPLPKQPTGVQWPTDAWPEDFASNDHNRARLNELLELAFKDADSETLGETHAFLAVQRGKVVAEQYADGKDQTTTFPSWSKAKSITHALIGILVRAGKIDIHAAANAPEWKDVDDPRKDITLDELLRMSSGLQFAEDYVVWQRSGRCCGACCEFSVSPSKRYSLELFKRDEQYRGKVRGTCLWCWR